MPKSKDSAVVVAEDLPSLRAEVNFIFQRIMDRLDKLEGLRDSFDSQSDGNFEGVVTAHSIALHDENETVVHSLGDSEE